MYSSFAVLLLILKTVQGECGKDEFRCPADPLAAELAEPMYDYYDPYGPYDVYGEYSNPGKNSYDRDIGQNTSNGSYTAENGALPEKKNTSVDASGRFYKPSHYGDLGGARVRRAITEKRNQSAKINATLIFGTNNLSSETVIPDKNEIKEICISIQKVCDGTKDCYDGTDEANCSLTNASCLGVRCDNISQCPDGTDECGCPGSIKCNSSQSASGSFCLPPSKLCDGMRDCDDGFDERHDCEWFHCHGNGKQIAISKVCDGKDDCFDQTSSDECNCTHTFVCENFGFGRKCIHQSMRCDGNFDCPDGSDECDCHDNAGLAAAFRCNGSKLCIPPSSVCDGTLNCGNFEIPREVDSERKFWAPDCSDEEARSCATVFQCHDAKELLKPGHVIRRDVMTCVPTALRCNGIGDCDDASDECGCDDSVTCPGVLENRGRFLNSTGETSLDQTTLLRLGEDKPPRKCLLRRNFCDGKAHCDDGTDERASGFGFKCRMNSSVTVAESCVLPQFMIDDGVVDCTEALDECRADGRERCFQCFDKSMLISGRQVCDGVLDCPDLTDECLCDGTKSPRPSICDEVCNPFSHGSNCSKGSFRCRHQSSDYDIHYLSLSRVCDGHTDCLVSSRDHLHLDEDDCSEKHETSERTIECPRGGNNKLRPSSAAACDMRPECADLFDECSEQSKCATKPQYCQHLKPDWKERGELRFACPNDGSRETFLPGGLVCDGIEDCEGGHDEMFCPGRFYCKAGDAKVSIDHSQVCDGKLHCIDRRDELNCSKYFYCENGHPLFVPKSSMFDGTYDCSDKSDECPATMMENTFASATEMIGVPSFRILVWIMAILSLSGNFVVVSRQCFVLLKTKVNSVAKTNHILILNLAAADFLTGVYLLTVAIHSVKFSGVYCQMDKEWRTGSTCAYLGFLNSVATETSVVMLVIMTSVRMHSVFRPFNTSRFSPTKVGLSCILAWVVVIITMLPPRLPRFSHTFANSIWIRYPFFASDIVTRSTIQTFSARLPLFVSDYPATSPGEDEWEFIQHFAMKYANYSKASFPTLGYYSKNSVCMPNMLAAPDDAGVEFSAAVTAFNFIAIVYVIGAYFFIYKRATRKAKALQANGGKPTTSRNRRDGAESGPKRNSPARENEARAVAMQRRIFRLVTSNVACWGPVTVMALLKLGGVRIGKEVYAVAAIVLLPINSALNPILYANVFDVIRKCCAAKPGGAVAMTTSEAPTTSIRDTTTKQSRV